MGYTWIKRRILKTLLLSVDLLLHVVMNLFSWNNNALWLLYDFHIFAKTVLNPFRFLQWQVWFAEKTHKKFNRKDWGNPKYHI